MTGMGLTVWDLLVHCGKEHVYLRQRTDKAIREKAQCELGLKKSDEQYVVIEK